MGLDSKRRDRLMATRTPGSILDRAKSVGGFTLIELLIVVGIILIVSMFVAPSVLSSLDERKFSDASRAIHAMFAGARSRAISSGEVRGIRLVRDDNDPWEVSSLVYVGTTDPYSVGLVQLSSLNTVTPLAVHPMTGQLLADPVFDQKDPGIDGKFGTFDDIPRVIAVAGPDNTLGTGDDPPNPSFIRFDNSGRMYVIMQVQIIQGSPASLVIFPPATTVDPAMPHRYQIFNPPIPLAGVEPILLAEGAVIDVRTPRLTLSSNPGDEAHELLRMPRSRGIPNQFQMHGVDGQYGTDDDRPPEAWPSLDILFGPTGQVVGLGAQSPLIHLWLGERADKGGIGPDRIGGTADDGSVTRPHKMLTLNTRTGTVEITDNPASVAEPPVYPEIYGAIENRLGTSELDLGYQE